MAIKKLKLYILLIFIVSFFASKVQNSWGSVNIQQIKIPTENGQWVVADLFKPLSATKDNPAPVVIVIPGFQRSKETLSNISIELSRRGMVVISIDPYAQGGSSSSMQRRAATKEGYGMFAIVEYISNTDNLNYIDKSKIGVTGHSAGGLAAIRGAQYFGNQAKGISSYSKIHSAYVSGMLRMGFEKKHLKKIKSNIGVSYALYDEGAWQNQLKNGDLTKAPEILRLINHQLADSKNNFNNVEIGKFYGELNKRNKTIIHNEKVLHPLQPYDFTATKNQLNFFSTVFELDYFIPSTDQVWYWKELLTLILLVLSFLLIIPFSKLLLNFPYFKGLIQTKPNEVLQPIGVSRYIFWSLFFLSGLIACFSFIPMSELSKLLFSDASNRIQTWFFPQRMNNAIMLWAIFNGLIGLLLFFGNHFLFSKVKNKSSLKIKIKSSDLLKTFILGFTIFSGYFLLVFLIYYFFHVDFRFLFLGVKVFRLQLLYLLPVYAPLFFIFFFSNSLRVNYVFRIKNLNKYQQILYSCMANTFGLFLILIIQYLTLYFTGTVFWREGWLYVNLLFGIVPIMLILPIFNYKFFELTGQVYLGPITMSMILIMILLSNTVCYIPL